MPSKSDNTSQRLDRVEANLDRLAEETTSFQLAVRGAITAQQEQIADNTRLIADNARQIAPNTRNIAEVVELTRENARNWEQLRREFPQS